MRLILYVFAVATLVLQVANASAQESSPPEVKLPAAVFSQSECTGFIAEEPVPRDLFVLAGADDDFRSVSRQFVQGESIFLSQRKGEDVPLGAEYRVVRPANALFETMRYAGEAEEIKRTGKPYEDVALIKVTHLTPQGAVAEVTFSCEPVMPGDSIIPFHPRPIPDRVLSPPLDHFIVADEHKQHGRITASRNNFGYFGHDTAIYVDLGQKQGAATGQRLRIYKELRKATGGRASEPTPAETVGEAIILSVEAKSCVAIIISSYREISAGDFVELE